MKKNTVDSGLYNRALEIVEYVIGDNDDHNLGARKLYEMLGMIVAQQERILAAIALQTELRVVKL